MIIVSSNDVTYIRYVVKRRARVSLLRYVPIEIKQLELMIPRGRHYVILRARARSLAVYRATVVSYLVSLQSNSFG